MNERQSAEDLAHHPSVRQIEQLRAQFASALDAGDRPLIEEYLGPFPDVARSKLFRALLEVEVDYCGRIGAPVTDATFLQRFPEYRDTVAAVFSASSPSRVRTETFHAGSTDHDPQRSGTALQLAAGTQFRKYQLIELLGRGAFGYVYRARDTELDREVALKFPQAGTLINEEEVQRFLREARAAAQLEHPHVVPIYDAGELDGTYYIASAFIGGKTLRDYMEQKRGLPYQETATLTSQLASALHFAHNKGIIHRDVKPENVMIDQDGQPHVMDFGLARRDEAGTLQTRAGIQMGTPAYMSPEQAQGKSHLADARSDLWSLGVMLYELLTGERPFQGRTTELLFKIQEEEPRPPRQINRSIPKDLETICLKCLRKSAEQRYPSCQHLADELERWKRKEPITASPISNLERAGRWCLRNPAIAVLSAAAVVLLFSGTTVASYFAYRANRNALDAQQNAESYRVARRLADRRRYGAELNHAQSSVQKGQIATALDLLDGVRPEETDGVDLRGWDWYYLNRLCHSELLNLSDNPAVVNAVAVSPEGQWIGAGAADGTVRLWDARTGDLIHNLKGHNDRITCVAFSPDGKRMASASADASVRIWDATAGTEALLYEQHVLSVVSLAFHPQRNEICTASEDCTIRIWDVADGKDRLVIQTHLDAPQIYCVAFSPDGSQIAAGLGAAGFQIWNSNNGESQVRKKEPAKHLAFTPDGAALVLAGSDSGKAIRTWSSKSDEIRMLVQHSAVDVQTAALSPNGNWFAFADKFNSSVVLCSLNSGAPPRELKGHLDGVQDLAFDPESRKLVSTSLDGSIKVWDITNDPEVITLVGHHSNVISMAFNRSGDLLLTGGQDYAGRMWNVANGELLHTLGKHEFKMGPPRGELPGRIVGSKTLAGHNGLIRGVAFSPDGQWVATASTDGTLRIWEADTGKEAQRLDHNLREFQDLQGMLWHPRGSQIVLYAIDCDTEIWDVDKGQRIGTLPTRSHNVLHAAFTQDGAKLTTAGQDQTVRVWDFPTGAELSVCSGHTAPVQGVAFSPNGELVASASADRTIRVWGAADQHSQAVPKELLTIRGHSEEVSSVAFSPDGQRLASTGGGSADHALKIWDAVTGNELLSIPGQYGPVVFSPDGKRIACSGGPWCTARVFDANPLDAQPYRLNRGKRSMLPIGSRPVPTWNESAKLKILGYFTAKQVPAYQTQDDSRLYEVQDPAQVLLVVVVSAPHHYLVPSEEKYDQLKQRRAAEKKSDIQPRNQIAIETSSVFRLQLANGRSLPASRHTRWPLIRERPSGFMTASYTLTRVDPVDPSFRRLLAIAWVVDPADCKGPLQVQIKNDAPVPVPMLELLPPRIDNTR